MWLQLLHPSLPHLVKQRYVTELCSQTFASVKSKISQALDSLLDELHTSEEPKVICTAFSNSGKPSQTPCHHSPSYQQPHWSKPAYRPCPTKSCTLCFQAGQPDHRSHFLSTCPYLPESDHWFMSKSAMWQIFMTLLTMKKMSQTTTTSLVLPPHLIVTIIRPAIPQHVV